MVNVNAGLLPTIDCSQGLIVLREQSHTLHNFHLSLFIWFILNSLVGTPQSPNLHRQLFFYNDLI